MGDILAADFKAKKYLGKVSEPVSIEQLGAELVAIADELFTDDVPRGSWPGMGSANYVASEKDPA